MTKKQCTLKAGYCNTKDAGLQDDSCCSGCMLWKELQYNDQKIMICQKAKTCELGFCHGLHRVPHEYFESCDLDTEFCPNCIPYVESQTKHDRNDMCSCGHARMHHSKNGCCHACIDNSDSPCTCKYFVYYDPPITKGMPFTIKGIDDNPQYEIDMQMICPKANVCNRKWEGLPCCTSPHEYSKDYCPHVCVYDDNGSEVKCIPYVDLQHDTSILCMDCNWSIDNCHCKIYNPMPNISPDPGHPYDMSDLDSTRDNNEQMPLIELEQDIFETLADPRGWTKEDATQRIINAVKAWLPAHDQQVKQDAIKAWIEHKCDSGCVMFGCDKLDSIVQESAKQLSHDQQVRKEFAEKCIKTMSEPRVMGWISKAEMDIFKDELIAHIRAMAENKGIV